MHSQRRNCGVRKNVRSFDVNTINGTGQARYSGTNSVYETLRMNHGAEKFGERQLQSLAGDLGVPLLRVHALKDNEQVVRIDLLLEC